MTTYQEYLTHIKLLVDEQLLSTGSTASLRQVMAALEIARSEHSINRKVRKVVEYAGTGARLYALPDSWEEGFSEGGYIVEFPVDDTAAQVEYLRTGQVELYNTPSGTKLRFRENMNNDSLPGEGQAFRLHFNSKYALGETSVTVPKSDAFPVCDLAIGRLFYMITARFTAAAKRNPNGSTERVEYQQKAAEVKALGDTYYDLYRAIVMPKGKKAAFTFGEFIDDPQHKVPTEEYARDESGRMNNY